MPCLFCGSAFRDSALLTVHLDLEHENWVPFVMSQLGLSIPEPYPIEEYRRALAEAFVAQVPPTACD